MAFWATCKIAQPIQPIWQHIFALPWSALKKPPWEFNFFHIFGIPSSSRHEKRCQMLQTLFLLFQCSKNPMWHFKKKFNANSYDLQAHWGQDFTSQNIPHWNTLLMVNWQNENTVVNVLLKNSWSLFQSKPKKMSKNTSICKNWMKWMIKNVILLGISNREIHLIIRFLEEWPQIWKMTVFLWLVLEM